MSITIISNKVCPFAQRTLIVARQKKLDLTVKQVSLINKEPYFTQTYKKAIGCDPSNNGKVPILLIQDNILAQSDLISWLLAEKYQTGTNLIPKDLFERAKMRHFIQNVPSKIISAFYIFRGANLKPQEEQNKLKANLIQTLQNIESLIIGPYVLGEQISLADIMLYPWFERFCVIQDLYNVKLPQKLVKLHKFIKIMQERPSIQENLSPREYFVESYKDYMIQK